MSDYEAGGGKKLSVVRYGRDLMEQHEGPAAANVMPGDVLMPDGSGGYALHDGSDGADVYVAVEARGRGMDAQDDDGYASGEELIAVRPAGGGLNLRVATGENVTDGDQLAVQTTDPGRVVTTGNADSGKTVGHAAEDADLSGASEPTLVGADME